MPKLHEVRLCSYRECDDILPDKVGGRKFCSDEHRIAEHNARRSQKRSETTKRIEADATKVRPMSERQEKHDPVRRGPKYEAFVQSGHAAVIHRGERSIRDVAAEVGINPGTVSRYMRAYEQDVRAEAIRENHEAPEKLADDVEDFAAFRARYFRVAAQVDEYADEEGMMPYLTPGFQKRWIRSVLDAMKSGGRLMILSPPRHGKSELLTHFAIWLICRNPNVRIMWVGTNEDVAKLSLGLVRLELEENERLIEDFTGGLGFRPDSRTLPWTDANFIVATRTTRGMNPTMKAIGKGGKVLSRGADLIVVDDVIDHKSVQSPTQRQADARWMRTQVSTRKQRKTALMVIGSRQHHDDMYGGMMESPSYEVIVESAHDIACTLDPEDVSLHHDCVLFPEINPYDYLMEQKADLDSEDPTLWPMVYQNDPSQDETAIFTMELMAPSRNHMRIMGDLTFIPEPEEDFTRTLASYRLIAGLDPATVGFQAAALWAVDDAAQKRWLIDLSNDRGGGLPGAESLIRDWYRDYGCRVWVIESNNYQLAIKQVPSIVEFCQSNAIRLIPQHTTSHNKFDPVYGVTTRASLYRQGLIDLPYGDRRSQRLIDEFLKQHLTFTGESRAKNRSTSDLLMASWFPEPQIHQWRHRSTRETKQQTTRTRYPYRKKRGRLTRR